MAIEPLWRDVRFSARVLRRNSGFTAVAVLTIAIGVGGATTLFSIVRGALLEPWPYVGYDRIVTLRGNSPRLGRTGFPLWSAAEYRDLAARTDVFDAVIAGEGRGVTIGSPPDLEHAAAGAMTANTWAMLGVAPLLGRTFDAAEDRAGGPHVVVVSDRFWLNRLAGRADAIGTVIEIDRIPFTVIGVMPPEFVWWDRDLWVPLQLDPADRTRTARRWYIQARLRAGIAVPQAEAALQTTSSAWHAEHRLPEYESLAIDLLPLVSVTLGDVRQVLYLLLAAVAVVLIVASANVATLLLIRGMRRRGEIAVRLALGGGRVQIVRQLLTESVLIALVAAMFGVWLASLLLPWVVGLIPFGIPAEAHIALDWRAAAFGVGAAVAAGAVFGIVPAWRAVSTDLVTDLKASSRRTAGGSVRALDAFMAVQFALALVVVSACAVVVRGFESTVKANPGFDDGGVLTFRAALPDPQGSSALQRGDVLSTVLQALRAQPGVEGVAATTTLPVGPGPRASFSPDRGATQLDANVDSVAPGFFAVLKTPIVAGRAFTAADDRGGARVAIVNETAARRFWPASDGLGGRLSWLEHPGGPTELVVVGIARDIKRDPMRPAAPAVFVPAAQEPAAAMSIVLRASAHDEGLFAAARSAIAAAAPDVAAYSPRMLADVRTDALGSERLAAVLLTAFAAIAIALSVIGMYGVTRYTVEQRSGELAVRAALGAGRRELLALVLSRSVGVLSAGAVVGAFGSWAAVRVVTALLVDITGGGATVIAVAAAPLIGATLLAAYLPGRRAAEVNPVDALNAS